MAFSVQFAKANGHKERVGTTLSTADHDLVLCDERSFDQELRHIKADVTLQLEDNPKLLIIFEDSIRLQNNLVHQTSGSLMMACRNCCSFIDCKFTWIAKRSC